MKGVKIALLVAGVVCQIAAAPQLLSAAALSTSGIAGIASLATDTQTLMKGIDFVGDVTRFATHMVRNASEVATDVARVGLNRTADLGGRALQGGIGISKQGISLALSAAKHFPGGEMMNFIAPVATVGVDFAGRIAGKTLNLTATGGDKVLNLGNRLVQNKAELVNTGTQKLIGLGRVAVGKMDSVKNSVSGLTSNFGSRVSSTASRLTSALPGSVSTSGRLTS